MPRKVFVAGEILTAADVNTNLMDQSVMVFDDDAARTTAIPTPAEGMVTYLKDEDKLFQFDGSNFVAVSQPGILQVVSTTKTDTFTTASTTFVDITGMSVSITPTSATSKIFVTATITGGSNAILGLSSIRLIRDSTPIAIGDSAGSRTQATSAGGMGNSNSDNSALLNYHLGFSFLDSPGTTSALTYKVDCRVSTGSLFVNRASTDDDSATRNRTVSTITVMEVAG